MEAGILSSCGGIMTTNSINLTTATAKDPVCGMSVDTTKGKLRHEYKGQTYYFCCAGCLEKFRLNPETYLKPRNAALATIALAPAKVSSAHTPGKEQAYVCPMCLEVREAKPGACPSCGMAL